MNPRVRKIALVAHVTASVGWLGAVAAFLALAVTSLAGADAEAARGLRLAMEVTGRYVLVPLSLASLLTGLVQSLGTPWGLFRHYWVIAKLVINVFASLVLLLFMQTLGELGARDPSPVLHAGGALLLLLVATTLSVVKPPGLTRYGRRRAATLGTVRP